MSYVAVNERQAPPVARPRVWPPAAAAVFVALVLALVGAVPFAVNARVRHAGDRLVHDLDPLLASGAAISKALVDQETGQRGYVITAAPAFLAPYDEAETRLRTLWPLAATQAQRVGGDTPALLQRTQAAAMRWQAEAGAFEVQLVQSGQREAAVQSVALGRGKALFEQFRAAADDLDRTLNRLRQATTEERSRLVDGLVATQATLAALGLLSVTALFYLVWTAQRQALRAVRAEAAVQLQAERARLYEVERESRLTAEAALRVRDEFVGSVSHDLRSPLTSIKGMVQLVLLHARRADTPENAKLAERMTLVERAIAQMTGMIDELLDLTRLESGRPLELKRKRVDAPTLVRQVAADYQRAARRHTITVVAEASPLTVQADADRLERVLANLLSNAVKYSPDGDAITVSVAPEAEPQTGVPGVAIRVRDMGIGIPAADLPHIFARFHRGSNVQGRINGVGIGLAGAKQIVTQHGGRLTAASVEGEGATFTVWLPGETQREKDDESA